MLDLFIIFSISALIFVIVGAITLIISRLFEKNSDKIAETDGVFLKMVREPYRGKVLYSAVYEYTVGGKKIRKKGASRGNGTPKKTKIRYLKMFPKISYLQHEGNDFRIWAFVWFFAAAVQMGLAVLYLLA